MKNPIFFALAFATIALLSVSACSDNDAATPTVAKTYVLVHGAWQAPYVWQAVKEQLEQKGNKVVVVELPGHGADNTPPATLSIDVYRDKVVAAIAALPGNVILVGHSMGGMVITATAEKIPTRIERLVYVGAFLPATGQSLLDLTSTDSTSLLGAGLVPSADHLLLGVKAESLINIFIQDGSDAIKKSVADNYRAEPAIPFASPVIVTAANFGSVAKYYVHTVQDHAIGLNLQKRMVAAAGIKNIYSLNSSHCPFLSMPTELTTILLGIAN
ncbi:alpha/beta fold hydrolase [Spirosoma endbachense]|uniref:Alpha/beta fold hydrolase n=1 Tax=Spirosoma endbachense TaxID=2666025 RepID=A0A6P1W4X0_9BACT|nr:alpha/beta fold hydrolase [Spirosoma endbachense]QHV99382.1 alpha/beta fold hydrolase [Spirosoma endbachense]